MHVGIPHEQTTDSPSDLSPLTPARLTFSPPQTPSPRPSSLPSQTPLPLSSTPPSPPRARAATGASREPSALARAPSELLRAASESLAPSSPALEPRSAFSEYSSSVSHASADDQPRGWRASILSTLGGTLGRAAAARDAREHGPPTKQQSRGSLRKAFKERDEPRGRLPHISLGRSSRPSSAPIEPFTMPATRSGHYAAGRRGSASPSRWGVLRRAGSSSSQGRTTDVMPPPLQDPPQRATPSPSRLQPLRMRSSESLQSPRGPRPLQPLRRVPSDREGV
ncbi:hypothetical protein HDZ31DRAFT_45520 [Schizophyllum fasciatum]